MLYVFNSMYRCVMLHMYSLCYVTHVQYVLYYTCTVCVMLHVYSLCYVTRVQFVLCYTCTVCVMLHVYSLCYVTHVQFVLCYTCTVCVMLHMYTMYIFQALFCILLWRQACRVIYTKAVCKKSKESKLVSYNSLYVRT